MSKVQFKPAELRAVSVIAGFIGGTGSGKTYSALRFATGLAGGERFAVIDTEAGRAQHYAKMFEFDHGDLQPPFTPDAFRDAIVAADEAKYPVIVVDSFSHEWYGDGGVLEMQEKELDRMAGTDWQKREACKMASWIKPKTAHKKMVQRLLQLRAHLVICLRAEEKIEMERKDGKMQVVPKKTLTGLDGWVPICEKNLPYEFTMSFLLLANQPGVPHPIKLQAHHRDLFDLGKPIDEESGKRMAAWAAGDENPKREARKAGRKTRPSQGEGAGIRSAGPAGTAKAEASRANIDGACKRLQGCKSTDALEEMLGKLCEHFDWKRSQLPFEVDVAYGEMKEALQQ